MCVEALDHKSILWVALLTKLEFKIRVSYLVTYLDT